MHAGGQRFESVILHKRSDREPKTVLGKTKGFPKEKRENTGHGPIRDMIVDQDKAD